MADVGALLRDRRVELKQDIDTAARQTRIKVAYLKAIEDGRRRDLPGTAYTIGFVRTYADYLGFDGNRLVNDFHAQLAGERKRAADAQAAAAAPRSTLSPVGIAAGVLTLAMVAFFTWGYLSDRAREADDAAVDEAEDVADGEELPIGDDAGGDDAGGEEVIVVDPVVTPEPVTASAPPTGTAATTPDQAAASPVEDQLPPEADAAPPAVEPEPEPAPVQEATAEPGQPGKIVLRARLESWVQITNQKGESILSRVLRAGETYTVPNEPGLMMTTGNAGGIDIVLDDKKLKSLGSVGLVRRDIPLDPEKLRDGSAFQPGSGAPGG